MLVFIKDIFCEISDIIRNLVTNKQHNKISMFENRVNNYNIVDEIVTTFKQSKNCLDNLFNANELMIDGKFYFQKLTNNSCFSEIGKCIENFDTNEEERQKILKCFSKIKKLSCETMGLYGKRNNELANFIKLYGEFLNHLYNCNCYLVVIKKLNVNNYIFTFEDLAQKVNYGEEWNKTKESYNLLKQSYDKLCKKNVLAKVKKLFFVA